MTDWTPWIPHDGGPCPIPGAQKWEWEAQNRYGKHLRDLYAANEYVWEHDGEGLDIIAYRTRKSCTLRDSRNG